jgi:hypothetical protein
VPFAGSDGELAALVRGLGALQRAPGDEVLVADNRRDAGVRTAPVTPLGVEVVAAPGLRTPYFARNVAAARARAEWLVFLDADVEPAPDVLERYLAPAPPGDVAVLAGGVRDVMRRDTACARYVQARAKMASTTTLSHPRAPYAQTANCAVRRSAFAAAGGFVAGVRSGGDADLCWRLAAGGSRLEERPEAWVEHRNRERFGDLLGQVARHGSGMAWLDRRWPGSFPAPPPRDVVRRVGHYGRAARRAQGEERLFALADLATLCARDLGRLRSNRARP